MKRGCEGFTVFEMLVVLFIVGFMMSIVSLLPTAHVQSGVEERIFFEQLRNEMNYAQEVALIENVAVNVAFVQSHNEVRLTDSRGDIVQRMLSLPSDWRLRTNFDFSYLPNGHITYFKTIEFEHEPTGSIRKIVMQLGSGKFDIK